MNEFFSRNKNEKKKINFNSRIFFLVQCGIKLIYITSYKIHIGLLEYFLVHLSLIICLRLIITRKCTYQQLLNEQNKADVFSKLFVFPREFSTQLPACLLMLTINGPLYSLKGGCQK